jgi:Fic family protein
VGGIDALNKVHASEIPPESKFASTIEIACKIASEFMRIHPYADGNGHIGRICLLGILTHFGYFPKRFPIEPRPDAPGYSDAIYEHQQGRVEPFHKYVEICMN